MMLQIARFITESLAALRHLTPVELALVSLGLAIDVATLAALRMLAPRSPTIARARTEYDEAA
jgi:hypothetical protein